MSVVNLISQLRVGTIGLGIAIPLASVSVAQEAPTLATGWTQPHEVSVRLVSTVTAAGGGDVVGLGLHFKTEPGWRVYWWNPLGFSYAPTLDTGPSVNLKSARIRRPVPTHIPVYGHLTLGYQEEVVLPVDVILERPGQPLLFRAELRYLACSEVCIPTEASLALTIPARRSDSTVEQALVDRFRERVPREGVDAGLSITAVEAYDAKTTALVVSAESETRCSEPDIVVGGPDAFEFGEARSEISRNGSLVRFGIPATMIDDTEPKRLPGTELIVIVSDATQAVSRRLTVAAAADPVGSGWWRPKWLKKLFPSDPSPSSE